MPPALLLPSSALLSAEDEAALTDLYRRGTPENTIRAWERDRGRKKAGLASARSKGRVGGNPGLRAKHPVALR